MTLYQCGCGGETKPGNIFIAVRTNGAGDINMTRTEPEWNAQNINRKIGSTNFRICGWCKYTGGGTSRYGCMLSSSCTLLKSYGNNEVKWDTTCIFKALGQLDLVDIIHSKRRQIDSLSNQIKDAVTEIETIAAHLPDHANSPPLPKNRSHDFIEGETIYVVIDGKWERGTVVPGYRSHDGMVSYCLDNIPGSSGWGCGTGIPNILRAWEWEYFIDHAHEYIQWKRLCESDKYNGKKIVLPPIVDDGIVPQIEIGNIVYCRNAFKRGYWTGSVVKIVFKVGDSHVVEVDEVDGDGRAMFSTDMLKYKNGYWCEINELDAGELYLNED